MALQPRADASADRRRCIFLDLPFDRWTLDETIDWIVSRDAASPPAYVVTPNVDHMVRFATLSSDLRHAYEAADLILCDSRVMKRFARLLGYRLTLVPGSDLTRRLLARLSPGDRVCLIGGESHYPALLKERYPALDIVQHVAPMGLLHDRAARAAAIADAARAGARVTLLAVGSPQQELLGYEMRESGRVRGTILCIGASVRFLTGGERRAPVVMQWLSLEWAWRLAHDPRRLAYRYLVKGPSIFPIAWGWARRQRRR